MAYDRIDWHSGGDYPAGLPEENGGIHIGMFLAWAFGQGMAGRFTARTRRTCWPRCSGARSLAWSSCCGPATASSGTRT